MSEQNRDNQELTDDTLDDVAGGQSITPSFGEDPPNPVPPPLPTDPPPLPPQPVPPGLPPKPANS